MKRHLLLVLSIFSFSVLLAQTVPLPPTNLTVSHVTDSSFTANWDASAGATSYRWDVATDPRFVNLIRVNRLSISNSDTIHAQQPGMTYYFRVRAVNAAGVSANSVVKSVTIVPAPPAKPWGYAYYEPRQNGPFGFRSTWKKVLGANEYRMDISKSPNFDTFLYKNIPVGTSYSADSLEYRTPSLLPAEVYYFRIRSQNSLGVSKNSQTITIHQILPNPIARAATNIFSYKFTANWGFAVALPPTGIKFQVQVSSSPDFLTVFLDQEVSGVTSAEMVFDTSRPGDWYYRVRAKGFFENTGYSNVIKVTLPPLVPVAKQGINVYPNPIRSNEFLNVEIGNLAAGSDVRVNITSLAGDVNVQYDFTTDENGALNARVPVSTLKPGTYILNVNDKSTRFVVN